MLCPTHAYEDRLHLFSPVTSVQGSVTTCRLSGALPQIWSLVWPRLGELLTKLFFLRLFSLLAGASGFKGMARPSGERDLPLTPGEGTLCMTSSCFHIDFREILENNC